MGERERKKYLVWSRDKNETKGDIVIPCKNQLLRGQTHIHVQIHWCSEFLKLVDGFDILQIFPSLRERSGAHGEPRGFLDLAVFTARSFMPTGERLSLLDQDRGS